MTRTSRFSAPAAILAAFALVLGLAPAAGAQSVMPISPPGIPQLENAPAPVPPVPGLPVLTYPVLGPERPDAEYGGVSIFPTPDETVGVAQPVMFFFDRPIRDRARAEATLGVRTEPAVSGKFYWISDTEVRWRPHHFWPANSSVTVWAGGKRQQSFRTGDALVAEFDDNTKLITVTRNGQHVRTMKASAGRAGWETYNGIYYTGQRGREVRMNSEAFGLRIADGGYDSIVNDAVRMSYDGIYIHSAPWSIADQGVRNVSHGCINVSPEDARWYYDNTRNGDPIIVKNGPGRPFGAFDGQGDWNY
ncbi:Ig-like domain-containing protein [Dietzia sp. 179-F 9C3 NHS]|uniref:L,D-transpeptidase n=1 Tax=Dietzia sp. 179-F 9C3 NHS TaxID=3374295 RepID=UPI00387A5061